MELALAIELDGLQNSVGVADRSGKVLDSEQVATSRAGMVELSDLRPALDRLRVRSGRWDGEPVVGGVSIGVGPSLIRPSADAPSPAAELAAELSEHLGIPVAADDIGRAFTLAEGWLGAAKGVDNFATIRIDEVVSGGIVLDGRLLDGGLGGAGRIGHVIVRPDGRRCSCGSRGCLEAEVSVSSIEAWTGRPLTEPGYDHMRQVGRHVGRAAAMMANLLDLRLIVCGGRVAREYASTMFLAAQDELDSSCQLSFSRGARIVSAKTPEPSGLVGAAALGWRELARE